MSSSRLRRMFIDSPWPYRIMRVLLAGVFVWAGAVKLSDPRAFARTLSKWDIVPDPLLAPVAIGLPAFELLAGLGLAFNVRGSLTAISGMLLMFLALLGYGISRNLDVDCGCFSSVEDIAALNSLESAFYRDLWMLGIVVYLFVWRWFRKRFGDGSVRAGVETEVT